MEGVIIYNQCIWFTGPKWWNKISCLKTSLWNYFLGIPCITDCVMAELEKLGSKYRVALRYKLILLYPDKRFRYTKITYVSGDKAKITKWPWPWEQLWWGCMSSWTFLSQVCTKTESESYKHNHIHNHINKVKIHQKISLGNSMFLVIFGINTTSDISKLLYRISWAINLRQFGISQVVFLPNITYKSCYYLFILLPAKGL